MGEGNVCVLALPVYGNVENRKSLSSNELKREELRVSPKNENATAASTVHTDDLCSGDSDEIANCLERMETSSCNNPADLGGSENQVNSGDITSESSANSCTEFGVCTSQVVKEIPNHASTTGSLKIRIRIRPRTEEYKSNSSTSEARLFLDGFHDGITSKILSLEDKHTDDERVVIEQGAFPTKRAGKSLNQHSTTFVTGLKRKRGVSGGRRDDSLHKLLFKPFGIPDGAYLAYRIKGQKILEGYKQGNGIFCGHCSKEISPSQFEAHAGMSIRKKPYQHIYDAYGRTLHDIAISLADIENQTNRKNNDDVRLTKDPLSKPKPIKIKLKRAVKKSDIDYGSTCVLCSAHDFSVSLFNDRTVLICDQCEKEYHVGCLRESGRCDLKELPKNKWFCCNDCERISIALRKRIARGSQVIPSSETSKINAKLLEKRSHEVADNDVQWRMVNGKCCLPEHLPLLSKAVYLFRQCFSPLKTLTGQDLFTMMIHGRSVSGQDFRGMYCVFLTVKSVVVSVGLLKILGREVAELPLVVTRKKFQGKGYFLALFSLIEGLLRCLKVEKLVVPAAEHAKSMWVNKFGFRDMSNENLLMYTRVFRLTEFSGTVMLEKQIEQETDCLEPFSDSRILDNLQ